MDIDMKDGVENFDDRNAEAMRDDAAMVVLTDEELLLVGGGIASTVKMACW